ncbi:hypothetical protein DHEL01_v205726 [Diaporthe helianthi]|uniref:Uncharacterized protein n=1 Tax=Diaporthe helianthi TaxID=158607 RepID=A0A2P5I067_DIAHE|nr:hypothetical protein DHEL01_v205726 [Diaporthe helianthi]
MSDVVKAIARLFGPERRPERPDNQAPLAVCSTQVAVTFLAHRRRLDPQYRRWLRDIEQRLRCVLIAHTALLRLESQFGA